MSRTIDWAHIRKLTSNDSWASAFFAEMKNDLAQWMAAYSDDPGRRAGWGHDYNCQSCSGRLSFDLSSPRAHSCPACGRMNEGIKLDEAWNNMYRGKANQQVLAAAVTHCIEPDPRYLGYIRQVLDLYASDYDRFDNRAVAMRFQGKIMNQHLDDAVGMMTIMLGLEMVREEFTPAELDRYHRDLFRREADLFDFFATRIYNIPVWIKCAEAMIGVLFDDTHLVDRAFTGKYGILDQLRRGVTADGLWYEGSMHYHFYTLQPLCYLLLACQWRNFNLPEMPEIRATVERMLEYPLALLFKNGQFPNPNDAHPVVRLDNYATQYECASTLFDNDLFRQACGRMHSGENSGGLWRLMFNHWPKCQRVGDFGSVNYADAYMAMLRGDDTEVFVKYGTHTRLHVHPDIMNIELAFDDDVVAADLGTGGYGSNLFAEWQRLTPSHNTVAIDMQSQRSLADGIVETFDEENGSLKVTAKGIYDAVNYTRHLRVGDRQLEDRFDVLTYEEHTMDWFFYCLGDLQCDYDTEALASLGDANGYQHLFDIRQFDTDGDWSVDFVLADKTIRVAMAGAPGTTVHLVNSYMDSTAHTRQGLVVRRRAISTSFDTLYTCNRHK
jgi:oligo-alginate lyase